jgi:hypothetical protein
MRLAFVREVWMEISEIIGFFKFTFLHISSAGKTGGSAAPPPLLDGSNRWASTAWHQRIRGLEFVSN